LRRGSLSGHLDRLTAVEAVVSDEELWDTDDWGICVCFDRRGDEEIRAPRGLSWFWPVEFLVEADREEFAWFSWSSEIPSRGASCLWCFVERRV
jgi:hypothetical protein